METVPAAGKPIPRGLGAKHCLVLSKDRPDTPDSLKIFRQRTNPAVGEARTHSIAVLGQEEISHGKKSKDSLNAGELLNPQPKTLLQAALTQLEEDIYASHVKGPLGKSAPSAGLPSAMDPLTATFGQKTVKGDSAGSLVSPQKSASQVNEESAIGRHLYKKSHNDFEVGEVIDRNYDWSKFTKESKYGIPTPHDNSGREVRLTMDWQKYKLVTSKQLDEFREKTQPQLGQVHDPIADSLTVGPDHTFGVLVPADDYNAGQLLHSSGPSVYLQCGKFDKGIMASIRHHLKKEHYCDFDHLLDGLTKLSSGGVHVDKEIVQKLFFEFRVPLQPEMLELLLTWCNVKGKGVDYQLLVQIMNWKLDLDIPEVERAVNAITEPADHDAESIVKRHNYKTSSQQTQAATGGIPTTDYRSFGTPTIRCDRPPPRIRRVADSTNYGDESDAYGLMYPSIYSSLGVYEQDFFTPRTPDQVRQIFTAIGVKMSDSEFKMFWDEAASRDTNGQVCIESFREVLEEIKATNKQN